MRLAVVGGGLSGLAAAHHLHQLLPDAELRLFEAGPRLGGPLDSERIGDVVLERGADSFLTRDSAAIELCRELGLADELVPTNSAHRRALVVCRGGLEPVPDGFVLMQPHDASALLSSPVLSLAGKLRAMAEPFVPAPEEATAPDYDESVASFATRRLGQEVFERLVEPLLAGIYVADAAELSLAATMPEFLAAEREHGSLSAARRAKHIPFRPPLPGGEGWGEGMPLVRGMPRSPASPLPSPPPQGEGTGRAVELESGARYGAFVTLRSGMSSLIDALATRLPVDCVRLATPIVSMAKMSDGRWSVTAAGGDAAAFDGMILAAPASRVAPLVEPFDAPLGQSLAQIRAASSVVVTLAYAREQILHPLDAFGFVVPRIENRQILAGSFSSIKFPDRGTAELTPVRVFLGGALRPDLIDRDDAALVAIAQQELADLIGARGVPREAIVSRWPESMPQYRVGHIALVGKIEKRLTAHAGLEFAGASYRGVGIPQCIRSGRAAAERLASQM